MTDTSGVPHLADRLNALFNRVPQRGSSFLHNNSSAAQALAERHGVQVTPTHLSLLRSGKRDNPSARLLGAIADLFDVPVTFFFDAELAERTVAELEVLSWLRDAKVRSVLARAADLNDVSPDALARILKEIRKLEGSSHDTESPR